MRNKFLRICSMLLVLALLVGMLPGEALAEAYQAAASETDLTASTTAQARIVEEVEEKRTEFTKQFQLGNGLYMAAVYPEAVHYETDNGWADIDNTLKLSSGVYTNTAGVWQVALPQQLSKNNRIAITKDGYTLSFGMAGELRQSGDLEVMSREGGLETASVMAEAESTSITVDGISQTFTVSGAQASTGQVQRVQSQQQESTHPEMILEKLSSRLQYAQVYSNTDITYDLRSNQVKESVIIGQYSSTLRGYRYYLDVGGMIPVLGEEGQIDFYDADRENVVMVMPAPFLVDSAMEFSYDVRVLLEPSGSGYLLTYLLPKAWLAESERAWPVTLDPIVSAEQSVSNIEDITAMERNQKSRGWGMLQAGYYSTEGKTRFYLKYKNLPTLSSSDVIVGAKLSLYKHETSGTTATVEAHKVLETWNTDEITWANQPECSSLIEDYAIVRAYGSYNWDVTDIVRGWYAGENTGMMFKANDAVENAGTNNIKQFYSSDWGSGLMPILVISFRNNNGLESYWDYTAHSTGRAGTGYINNYTGNLVWVHNDIGFGGNRMPVSISHV